MTSEQTRPPTLARIAELAGVSVPTVSKVINGRLDVSAHTRERVEEIVVREGYVRPRGAATRGAVRQGSLVELVISEVDSAWSAEVLSGVEQVLGASGMQAVLTAVHSTRKPGAEWSDAVAARGSLGAILVSSELSPQQDAALRRLSIPIVVVDPAGTPASDVHTVTATNWHGGFAATQHLLSLGHERIAMIGGPRDSPCGNARIAGYRSALQLANISSDPTLIRYSDFGFEQGRRLAAALLELPSAPTGIFAANDLLALGVYEELRAKRIRVPEDVSVIGFDDVPFAAWTSPPLTTVNQPLRRMGSVAAKMLISLIRGERPDMPHARMATNLVVRASTALAKSAARR